MTIKYTKLVAAAGIAALVFTLSGKSVFAEATATGYVADDGHAYTYSSDSDFFKVANYQSGWVSNFDLGLGISGGNSQNGNDDGNGIGTGMARGFGGSDNFLNSNVSVIQDVESDSANSTATVGEDGHATAKSYDNDKFFVMNHSHGYLENLTLGVAVSGFNSQNGNDDGNMIGTGSSEALALALNEVNSNWTMIGGTQSATANASVGDDGNAYAKAKDNDMVFVHNANSAFVGNASIAGAVSGFNSQSGNDDDNSATTGTSVATSVAANYVNSNVTVVNGINSDSTASASVGEDGNATSKSYDNDKVVVSNVNNAMVNNVSAAASVSGANQQNGNDDTNTITTGAAAGSSCSTNTVNSNWTVIGGTLPEGAGTGCH